MNFRSGIYSNTTLWFTNCQDRLQLCFHIRFLEDSAYLLQTDCGYVHIYCHMTSSGMSACRGGGWTLVMKIPGQKVGPLYSAVKGRELCLLPPRFIYRREAASLRKLKCIIFYWAKKFKLHDRTHQSAKLWSKQTTGKRKLKSDNGNTWSWHFLS